MEVGYIPCLVTVRRDIIDIPTALQAELRASIDQVITFAPEDTEMCVEFQVQDDQIALEGNETLIFILTIVDVLPNVRLGEFNTTIVEIIDDDGMLNVIQVS